MYENASTDGLDTDRVNVFSNYSFVDRQIFFELERRVPRAYNSKQDLFCFSYTRRLFIATRHAIMYLFFMYVPAYTKHTADNW